MLKNSSILVTGGTGSFGKAMLEKILFNKNISKISILGSTGKIGEVSLKILEKKNINCSSAPR